MVEPTPIHRDDFRSLLKEMSAFKKVDEGADLLKEMLGRHYGVENVVYMCLNLPSSNHKPLLSLTYTPEWQRHYAQRGYIDIDPVVRAGLGGILPIDWEDIDRKDPLVNQFFQEAKELNIGAHGLTIPIRGRFGEFALFSVTSNLSSREWDCELSGLTRDMMMLAYNFHAEVIDRTNEETAEVKLSLRESKCLKWKALGKTDSEIGEICGISTRTVRFHLEGARARLRAANVTHAVTKAIQGGFINLGFEPYEYIQA